MGKVRILAALMLIISLTGCRDAGTSEMSCTTSSDLSGGRASCSGSFDRLSGDKALSFDMNPVNAEGFAMVKISVTVQSGAVTVSFRNREGRVISEDASGSQPLTLENTVFVDSSNKARIDFDSAHGISMNVQYVAQFTG